MQITKILFIAALFASPAFADETPVFQAIESDVCQNIGLSQVAYILKDRNDAGLLYALPKELNVQSQVIDNRELTIAYWHHHQSVNFIEVVLSPSTLGIENELNGPSSCLTDANVHLSWLKSHCEIGKTILASIPKQLYSTIEIANIEGVNEIQLLSPLRVRIHTRYPKLLTRAILVNGVKGSLAITCKAYIDSDASEISSIMHGVQINANIKQVRGA